MSGKLLTMAETSSEGLTGPEGPTAKVTQVVVVRAQFLGAIGLRALFSQHTGLSTGLSECPQCMKTDFCQRT